MHDTTSCTTGRTTRCIV